MDRIRSPNKLLPSGRVFEPQQVIELTLEEIEAMRLVDLEHLTQEE
ncbi:MAG: DNA-binding protein, partial [Thermoplasmata archaeon]